MDPSRASKASNLESNFSIYVDRIWTVIGTSTDCAMGDYADLVGSITYKSSTLEYCTFVRKFSHLDMQETGSCSQLQCKGQILCNDSWYL